MKAPRSGLILLLTGLAMASHAAPADRVLLNGDIRTSNERMPRATAVAMSGETVVYVGDDAGARALVGEGTEVHDLEGRLVLPALIDAHTHPGLVAMSHDQLEMELVQDRETLLQNVTALVAEHPDRDVILGGYWDNGTFGPQGPHRDDLDRIEAERPVILYDYWGHTVWANSRALEVAGVDRNTADVVPGFSFYQRDAQGEATGWITESASSLFVNHFVAVTPEVEVQLEAFLNYLRGQGVTTLLDAGNFGKDEAIYAALAKLDRAGRLPVRYHGAYTLFVPDDYDTAVASVKRLNADYGSDRLRIDTLKIFHDGVIETRTADMFEDYLDTPGNSGASLFNEAQLHDLVVELAGERINLHVHSVGDKSTHTVLNAIEQAHATLGGPPPIRIALCHLETVLDSDFYRFKDLGVIASFTPAWHAYVGDHNIRAAIGDKADSQMRAQPMLADDAMVTFSSDITTAHGWHDDAANPWLGMQLGHNRQPVEGGAEAPLATPRSERISLDDLVAGYTRDGAYQLGREQELGSIEVGKRADLIVLNQNLYDISRFDIHATRPAIVIMDGRVVEGGW